MIDWLFVAAVAAAHGSESCSSWAPVERTTVEYVKAQGGERGEQRKPLLIDMYRPPACAKGRGKRPAVLMFHGGGFIGGARDIPEQVEYAEALAQLGYVVGSVQYRFVQDRPFVSVPFRPFADAVIAGAAASPALRQALATDPGRPLAIAGAAEDATAAVHWLVRNADQYGVDRERIALLGASAGAITALNVAYVSDDIGLPTLPIAAVIDIRGRLIDPANGRSALQPGSPPVFIVHGTVDDRIPPTDAARLYDQAKAAKIPAELHLIAGYGHELGGEEMLSTHLDSGEHLLDRIDRFLEAAFARKLPRGYAYCGGHQATRPK